VATVPGPVPFAVAPEMGLPLIAARVGGDVARFVAGEPLVGLVDLAAGY
jgi:alpha-D-ribose 1-methylphosphonate 5-triphosphate synthase subunit PhnG